jgi:hypothetical protein
MYNKETNMVDKQYYQEKLQKLQTKYNGNLQKLITCAFEVVAEAQDLNERVKEIQDLLKAEPKVEATQETKEVNTPA